MRKKVGFARGSCVDVLPDQLVRRSRARASCCSRSRRGFLSPPLCPVTLNQRFADLLSVSGFHFALQRASKVARSCSLQPLASFLHLCRSAWLTFVQIRARGRSRDETRSGGRENLKVAFNSPCKTPPADQY